MNILIVGAGAVGKVYGRHLALGGANVSFLVKEKYAETTKKGFTFYILNDAKRRDTPMKMGGFGVLTSNEEVKKQKWDYILLTMASNALRGEWINDLIAVMGDATLVTFQPGLNDHEFLRDRLASAKISPSQLLDGTIPIVSYEAPLPGETKTEPGTAYWLPMNAHVGLSGKTALVQKLAAIFNRGKLRTLEIKDVRKENILASPMLNLFILALEASGWSFQKLKKSSSLKIACAAMPEAIRINAKHAGAKAPHGIWALRPFTFHAIMTASKYLVPFDFETYLQVHFSKVREQTHQGLNDYISFGKEKKMPTGTLEFLRLHTMSKSV